jgi:mono/diheme cytochrome c family protein
VRAVMLSVVLVVLAGCSESDRGTDFDLGAAIYGESCASCHGLAGEGGVGPALDMVTETWPSCSDQIRWVELGSEGWKLEVGGTYGATGKRITGNMPGHRNQLSSDEIAAVSAFERVAFGGADRSATAVSCGLRE